jgi:hypothetical protein
LRPPCAKRLLELPVKAVVPYLEHIVLTKQSKAGLVASLIRSIRSGCVVHWGSRTIECKFLKFLPRWWLGILHAHVALALLRRLDVLFLSLFFIRSLVIEEELIVVEVIEIDDRLLAIWVDVNPFFRCFGHHLVTMGDHPDEPSGEIARRPRESES